MRGRFVPLIGMGTKMLDEQVVQAFARSGKRMAGFVFVIPSAGVSRELAVVVGSVFIFGADCVLRDRAVMLVRVKRLDHRPRVLRRVRLRDL